MKGAAISEFYRQHAEKLKGRTSKTLGSRSGTAGAWALYRHTRLGISGSGKTAPPMCPQKRPSTSSVQADETIKQKNKGDN